VPFSFQKLEIPDVLLIKPRVFPDDRGFFLETYKRSEFATHGINTFVQDNHSRSEKGVLRGLHFQLPPHEQGKLVRCIRGEIFDVAVDIRKGSPAFGKWVSCRLSQENKSMIYIPPGFAHGFYTMSEAAEVVYKVTAEYAPEFERGILWSDPRINIAWPSGKVLLSDEDKGYPLLAEAEIFD